MLESRRKYKRHELPLGAKFRPTYGAEDYFAGVTTNLSCEGLGLEAHDFRFIMYENLELIVELPESNSSAALYGDVVWKKQAGKRCLAGIKLVMKNKDMQKEEIEKILTHSQIPLASIYSPDSDHIIHDKTGQVSLTEATGPGWLSSELPDKLGVIKQYYEDRSRCRVTFRLLKEAAGDPQNVTIVGDFNDWDSSRSPMTRLENGDFIITMDLESNREYKFRYLINGRRWEIDLYADKFSRNDSGIKSSVVIV
jgi:hypothetical protein